MQPYASMQHSSYGRLEKGMNLFNLGLNWLMKGHTAKLSLNYENRPIFKVGSTANTLMTDGRRGALIMQYQISI